MLPANGVRVYLVLGATDMCHIRPKYARRICEGVEDDGPTVKTAPMPPQIIPQGIVPSGLLAHVAVAKYADALPLYRQEDQFARLGLDISRGTLWPTG